VVRYGVLPDELARDTSLFWDAAPGGIDPEAHAPYVIGRVLSLGRLAQVRALLAFYGRDRVRVFFRDGGLRHVDARTAAFWLLVLGLRRDECEPRSSPTPNATFWPG
jgi:hypothetical protein